MPPANSRTVRHHEVLARWPVLREGWAQRVERARTETTTEKPYVGPGSGVGITPLTAINRALGLPDDHGVDAIAEAQRTEGPA
jgi:hypothetical protein